MMFMTTTQNTNTNTNILEAARLRREAEALDAAFGGNLTGRYRRRYQWLLEEAGRALRG